MSDLDWDSLRRAVPELAAAARERDYAPGEHLLLAGEPAEAIFFATEGIIRVFEGRPNEPQFTAKILRAPVTAGIVEALNASSYVACVEALRPTRALRVPADAFRAALARDATFARAVLADVSLKFEGTMRLLGSVGFDDAEVRLCRTLLEYARHFGRPVDGGVEIRFALPRERLAREVGTAQRTVDRALKSLRDARLVWPSPKGWQVIASADALQAHVDARTARRPR